MSNPTTFVNAYTQNITQLCQILQALRGQNDQLTQDPTLVTRYFSQPAGQIRSDITSSNVTDASSAIVQILFSFDSGSPTQKSFLFKMFP